MLLESEQPCLVFAARVDRADQLALGSAALVGVVGTLVLALLHVKDWSMGLLGLPIVTYWLALYALRSVRWQFDPIQRRVTRTNRGRSSVDASFDAIVAVRIRRLPTSNRHYDRVDAGELAFVEIEIGDDLPVNMSGPLYLRTATAFSELIAATVGLLPKPLFDPQTAGEWIRPAHGELP